VAPAITIHCTNCYQACISKEKFGDSNEFGSAQSAAPWLGLIRIRARVAPDSSSSRTIFFYRYEFFSFRSAPEYNRSTDDIAKWGRIESLKISTDENFRQTEDFKVEEIKNESEFNV
jgi:hypothetical protein